jgi:hypothetical protein
MVSICSATSHAALVDDERSAQIRRGVPGTATVDRNDVGPHRRLSIRGDLDERCQGVDRPQNGCRAPMMRDLEPTTRRVGAQGLDLGIESEHGDDRVVTPRAADLEPHCLR